MIRSMTGFGRAEKTINSLAVTVELKSVNHRNFELSSRVPRSCSFLEEQLKELLKEKIARGKVEIYVTVEDEDSSSVAVEIDRTFTDAYVKALHSLSEIYGVPDDITASVIAGNNDVFSVKKKDIDEQAVTDAVLSTASDALESFISMREKEGEKLKSDVKSRAEQILKFVNFVEERSPKTVELYRNRLEVRIKELLKDVKVDEQRLLTETAIFADKIAVAEETVRLRSHISQLFEILECEGSIGKRLDFLVQEMNREANTIGSKAQDIEIAHTVVDIKSEIEKIREQIQNIE